MLVLRLPSQNPLLPSLHIIRVSTNLPSPMLRNTHSILIAKDPVTQWIFVTKRMVIQTNHRLVTIEITV